MIICSALYYPGSLDGPQSLVRDNRFYPGKAAETFPVWWAYLRKHYPTTHVHLFADVASPVPIRPLLRAFTESWNEEKVNGECLVYSGSGFDEMETLVTVQWLDQHSGQYFRPMQRNLVEAIKLAYALNDDLLWVDADCFLNTNVRPLVCDFDVASSGIQHHQQTMGSVCFYISKERLHALDKLGVNLPRHLDNLLANGPTEARMHGLQEGGLYKLFCYGRALSMERINMAHLSCYHRFLRFLRENPLNTPDYRQLVATLEGFDFGQIPGAELSFLDALHTEKEGIV